MTLTIQEGSIFIGELELGDTFSDCIDSLFAIRGDDIDDDKLKELITELHELCE